MHLEKVLTIFNHIHSCSLVFASFTAYFGIDHVSSLYSLCIIFQNMMDFFWPETTEKEKKLLFSIIYVQFFSSRLRPNNSLYIVHCSFRQRKTVQFTVHSVQSSWYSILYSITHKLTDCISPVIQRSTR